MPKKGRTIVQLTRAGQQVALLTSRSVSVTKKIQKKPNCLIFILIGIALNCAGAALMYAKAQMDKDVIQFEIDKKLAEYGVGMNGTAPITVEEIEAEEPSSLILVGVTMLGRMFNVVGTIKLFKGLELFLSEKRKKKMRQTAERLQGGEADADCSEAFTECCGVF